MSKKDIDHEEYEGTNHFWDTKTDWLMIGGVMLLAVVACGALLVYEAVLVSV